MDMDCPKCGMEMSRAGLEGLSGADIVEQWVCPACGYRLEMKKRKQQFE
jgi:rubredoxin